MKGGEFVRLNHDCIRQVLLDIEANLQLEKKSFSDIVTPNTISTYGIDNVIYSLIQLSDAQYIDASIEAVKGPIPLIRVEKITWEGHKFLDNVRDPQVWSKTKKVLKRIESTSITLVSNIASQVITNLIEKTLHL